MSPFCLSLLLTSLFPEEEEQKILQKVAVLREVARDISAIPDFPLSQTMSPDRREGGNIPDPVWSIGPEWQHWQWRERESGRRQQQQQRGRELLAVKKVCSKSNKWKEAAEEGGGGRRRLPNDGLVRGKRTAKLLYIH